MKTDNGAIVLQAAQNAKDQYTATLTISEIAELANAGTFSHKNSTFNHSSIKVQRSVISSIMNAICDHTFFYDMLRLAVMKDSGSIEYDGGRITIRGNLYVVNGNRRIEACQALAAMKNNDPVLDNRFCAMIYYVSAAELGQMVNQFSMEKSSHDSTQTLRWSFHPSRAIVDAINNSPDADPMYAKRISKRADALIPQHAMADCIAAYFPAEYMEESRHNELVRYLVDFLNIAIPFYAADYEDPATSVADGRFITNVYGVYALIILASFMLPLYNNDKNGWQVAIRSALGRLDVFDSELSSKDSSNIRTQAIKQKIIARVKDAIRDDGCSAKEYLAYVKAQLEDAMLSEQTRAQRLRTVNSMVESVVDAESTIGVVLEEGDASQAVAIIRAVLSRYSREYAYRITLELRKYMQWLTENKAAEFSNVVDSALGLSRRNDAEIAHEYFASIDDLRKTLDELAPLRKVPTSRDYDRIAVQLIFFGFRSTEVVCLPPDSLHGNEIRAYDKVVPIDDELRIEIERYRMNEARYADVDDGRSRRVYKMNHSHALLVLNQDAPKPNSVYNFRKRLTQYGENEKKLSADSIWRSGVYSRMIKNGTAIDPVTHQAIGKNEQEAFNIYKQMYHE